MRLFCILLIGVVSGHASEFVTGQAARAAIGQINFTIADIGATQSLLGGISGLAYANNMLFVADSNRIGSAPINNRVLIYHNITTQFPPPNSPSDPPNQGARCPVCGGSASVVVGQPDFVTVTSAATQTGLRTAAAVATDGHVLAIADTDNNRVLVWKTIPTSNNAPADVVIGQPDFTTTATLVPPSAKSMRGPQGVWIQNGKLFIADTQDHRVLIYNSIPTSNGAAADLVLGQPNFTTFVEPDLTQAKQDATADNLLNPVGVTSDGVRLYVTDLGHHRVLIWNSIPTQTQKPADVVVGQVNMTTAIPDNTPAMCASNGTDSSNNPTYPGLCKTTLSFPRYALSDGNRLFIADGGNDRVLVYQHVPTTNGAAADLVLGEPDDVTDRATSAADRLQTPTSLAWDGSNLYVADTFNRRVVVYTAANKGISSQGVRNAASLEVFAVGAVTFAGTIHAGDTATITIASTGYTYTVLKTDTLATITAALSDLINKSNSGKGDPNVTAAADTNTFTVVLTAKAGGTAGNNVTLATSVSSGAQITAAASSANLSGGQDAAQIGPGTLVTIKGSGFSESTQSEPGTGRYLPNQLANTRVYVDGNKVPLLYVSPGQVNAQMPTWVSDSSSVSLYVWTQHSDGTVSATVPVSVSIVPENPGIFAGAGNDPRPAVVFHGTPVANGLVSVDGTIKAGDVGTITINGRAYSYTVTSTDTLATVVTAFVNLIKKDPQVTARAAGTFTRVILEAKVTGKAGEGIPFSAAVSTGAQLLLTAEGSTSGTNIVLCCANTGLVTKSNPALAGETITVLATGLGQVQTPQTGFATGRRYDGPVNQPVDFVSALAGGKTANVLEASPLPGSVGIFELQLQLNSSLPTDPATQLTIAQQTFVSNIVAFPVKAP